MTKLADQITRLLRRDRDRGFSEIIRELDPDVARAFARLDREKCRQLIRQTVINVTERHRQEVVAEVLADHREELDGELRRIVLSRYRNELRAELEALLRQPAHPRRSASGSARAAARPAGERARSSWPPLLPVGATRFARPTDRLDAVRAFYGDALGLRELASFEGHAGYSGVVYGLPDESHQLEFTTHAEGSPCPAPSRDNLTVLYFDDADAVDRVVERLAARGHRPVAPENPYWQEAVSSFSVEDPDGWRVVLVKPRETETRDAADDAGGLEWS